MKKKLMAIFTFLFALMLSLAVLSACGKTPEGGSSQTEQGSGTAKPDDETQDDEEEDVNNGKSLALTLSEDGSYYIVTGIGECSGDVVIPAEWDGKPVKEIASGAFSGLSQNIPLTSITIGKNVETIGNHAFWICIGLESVIWNAENCTKAGSNFGPIFESCINLKTVTFGATVKTIPDDAFYNCDRLTGALTIPNSVTSIGDEAFYGCSGLTGTLTIPDGVTSIGHSAFDGCSGLTGTLTIPDSVTSIEDWAFDGCSGLMGIVVTKGNSTYHSDGNCLIETQSKTLILGCKTSVIPNDGSVTSIGNSAFRGCSGLTEIVIPDSVTSIGDWAFDGCSGLQSVTIGNSVTSIGEDAFGYCSGLTEIVVAKGNSTYHSDGNCLIKTQSKTLILGCKTSVIPNDESVTSIGNFAFYGCSGLTEITIPDSVTSIGEGAFYGCSGLESIVVDVNNSAYHSDGNCLIETKSKTLILGCKTSVIPNDESVTSIGNSAFRGCSGLTEIVIPDSVTSIGYYAFDNCRGLESVTFANPYGWIVSNPFSTLSPTAIEASELQNPSTAARYLRNYSSYDWERKD